MQKLLQRGVAGNGLIGLRTFARLNAPQRQQFTHLLIQTEPAFAAHRLRQMLGRAYLAHDPADGSADIDGRIMSLLGQLPAQHHMAVENGSGGIGHRILLIVAFGQYRIKGGQAAPFLLAVAGPLHQLGEGTEGRGRIPARHRGLAHRQADFTPGLHEARQRVHQQQHVLALVAKMFRHSMAGLRRPYPQQRALIGRCRYDHRLGPPRFTQAVIDKFTYLATPFANQPHHHHIGTGITGHHAEQYALADTGPGKQTQSLALARSQQGVDGPHPHIQRFAHPSAQQGVGNRHMPGHRQAGWRRPAVQWPQQTVDNAAQQHRRQRQSGAIRAGPHSGAGKQAARRRQRQQQGLLAIQCHYLGFQLAAAFGFYLAALAQHQPAAGHFQHGAGHFQQPPVHLADAQLIAERGAGLQQTMFKLAHWGHPDSG